MISAKKIRIGLVLGAILTTVGCSASIPPTELVTARSNYARAAGGPASQLAQADLDNAKKTLDVAEAAFKEDGDTPESKDLAYAAARNAEIAEVRARTIQANQVKDQTNKAAQANDVRTAQLTAAELAKTKGQLATQSQALATEKERREDAERRAAQAAADLAKAGDYAAAKTAYDALSAAMAKTGDAAAAPKWEKAARLGKLMHETAEVNSRIRRNVRRFARTKSESAEDAAVLLAFAQATIHDTHEVKNPADLPKWYAMAEDMRNSAAALSKASHGGDEAGFKAALDKLGKNCDACHEVFHNE